MDQDRDIDDDVLGGSSLGLSRVLASAGVDSSTLSRFLPSSSDQQGINAIDAESDNEDKYEDDVSEHELAPESSADAARRDKEKRDEERWVRRAMEMQAQARADRAGTAEGAAEKKARQRAREWEEVKRVWPGYEKGKRLKMSEVFYETPFMREEWAREVKRAKRRRAQPREIHVAVAQDTRPNPQTTWLAAHLPDLPVSSADEALYARPLGRYLDRTWIKGAKDIRRKAMRQPPPGLSMDKEYEDRLEDQTYGDLLGPPAEAWRNLDLIDWEKDIVRVPEPVNNKNKSDFFAPRNPLLDDAEWMREIVWDARRVSPDLVESDEDMEASTALQSERVDTTGQKGALDPLNISNDHLYEQPREARFRIRQTFGAIEVFHSYPAKILQLPWYKTTMSKAEARAWKRPAMQFPSGVWLGFHKLKPNPTSGIRKKQAMADPSERFKTSKDLTLTEKGPFVLLEFSEEYPPIMSSWGMGTTIVNYYRKKNDQDETVPKLDFGQPSILNPGDGEPYLLGYVDRGKVSQILHNNLIRAPVFRHEPETTDFLVIRQTVNGHSTYFLRPINNLYTVGQTTPNESEIPGPHARKNTNTAKMRLQQYAWLLMDRNPSRKLQIKQLIKYFPDQTELQIRQRLKIKGNEFLMYDRTGNERYMGPHKGHPPSWMLNPEYDFPKDRASVIELVPPEHAALYEAMQVGQRHLYDAGYSKTAEGNAEEEFGDDAGLDIEQQLAVWSTTLNYKRAEAQKAWLVVHGEGDPTGRGEGWSFLRANMKSYFLRKGETEVGRRIEAENKAGGNPTKISNAEQNRIYEEEKRRIWDLQSKALSNSHPPHVTAEEAAAAEHTPAPLPLMSRMPRIDSRRSTSRLSKTATPFGGRSRSQSVASEGGTVDGAESSWTGNQFAGKVMRITRTVKGKQVTEIVRDPAIMAAYARRATEARIEAIQQAATGKDGNLAVFERTGNEEEDQIRAEALRRALQRSELNQQRRAARRKYTSGVLANPEDADSTRRCGACGAMGHTKANRMCPMYGMNTGPSPIASTPTLTPGGYTPVGYGAAGGYFGMPPGQGGSGGNEYGVMESPSDVSAGTKIKLKLGAKKE